MSAPFIQITELPVQADGLDRALAAWGQLLSGEEAALYHRHDRTTVLELRAYDAWPDLAAGERARTALWDAIAPFAAGDFRREIIRRVEEPKPTTGPLPTARALQLRYVEVRPPVYDAYLEWREETIFDVVRGADEVQTFSAYHTVFTTRPGVLFLSGYEIDVDTYDGVFTSERYREIVRAAGDRYITGGDHGLSTHHYVRVESGASA